MLTFTTGAPDPTYPAFILLSSIAIILILLPSYWQFKNGNVGTILYIVWTFIGNLIFLVNAIAWKGNLHNPPWFWCDLSTALIVAINVAIPTSSLLITHRLYSIASVRQINISKSDSRRTKYFEFAFGIGLPILAVIFRVVVQGHRFDIFENIGCWPAIYVTPVTIPMVYLPPILINIVSSVYAFLAIRAFVKQRKQLSAVLASSHSGLTLGQYFRLVALAATEILLSLPLSIYLMVSNIQRGLSPWISWADTHQNFNRFDAFPLSAIKSQPTSWMLLSLTRFMLPVSAFLFFIYLGLSGESGVFYRRQFWRLAGVFGFSAPSKAAPVASWIALPRTTATGSVTSTTKETYSMDFSSRPLSFPPKFDDKEGSEAEETFRLQASREVHPSLA